MKTILSKLLLVIGLFCQASFVSAENNAIAITSITNPARSTGIQIGDVLKRSVTFESAASQSLILKALPAKGTRLEEIELVETRLERMREGSKSQYRLDLSYQVFASAKKPKVMALPVQTIKISSTEQLTLPAWHFWYSPLADIGITYAKANVQPQVKPPSIDINQHAIRISVFLASLLLAVLGLVYVNANTQWLPLCRGNFARAFKQIKTFSKARSPGSPALKKALFILHEAFNKTYGSNLFANNIDDFIAQHPRFKPLHAQIQEFFTLSNRTLFSSHSQNDADLLLKITTISKSLRDCERGVR